MLCRGPAIALLLTLASAATADDRPPLDQPGLVQTGLFQRWDRNGDHRLDADEFRGPPYLFAGFDADADLRLSEDEFSLGLFRHLDRDGSGTLDVEEMAELARWEGAAVSGADWSRPATASPDRPGSS